MFVKSLACCNIKKKYIYIYVKENCVHKKKRFKMFTACTLKKKINTLNISIFLKFIIKK